VIGRQGLTLLVMPLDKDITQPQIPVGDRAEASQTGLLRLVQQIGYVFANLLN
jgi:hypothetical protein